MAQQKIKNISFDYKKAKCPISINSNLGYSTTNYNGTLIEDTPISLTREVYRLDGNIAGTSTPLINGVGTIGNTVTISAPFKSLSPFIITYPNSGQVATITIDGLNYSLDGNTSSVNTLPIFGSNESESYANDMTISVSNDAIIEIWVTK